MGDVGAAACAAALQRRPRPPESDGYNKDAELALGSRRARVGFAPLVAPVQRHHLGAQLALALPRLGELPRAAVRRAERRLELRLLLVQPPRQLRTARVRVLVLHLAAFAGRWRSLALPSGGGWSRAVIAPLRLAALTIGGTADAALPLPALRKILVLPSW